MLNDVRRMVLQEYVRKRQFDLTVVLENVHDPHNLGAIMRTCDAVGIHEIYIIYTQYSKNADEMYIGNKASRGTKKWVEVHFYNDLDLCMNTVKSRYTQILATHLAEDAKPLYNYSLTESTAIVFGNERIGLSQSLLHYCTGNVIVPIQGMVQSLNVSVAAAVILYEAHRQRYEAGQYNKLFDIDNPQMRDMYREAIAKTHPRPIASDPALLDLIMDQEIKGFAQ